MPAALMSVAWVRRYCKSLPHTTETVQWGSDLVFKIGGKMYAVAALEPGSVWLSFKCTPETFADLTEQPGIIPAPYLARAFWVALEQEDALPVSSLKPLLKQAYETVLAKLPPKVRAAIK
jgi:predicted DNA-binding protein (MmcQ/YjbR family)